MSDSVVPWTVACQALLSSTISQSLLKFMSIESVILSSHLILCCPLLLLSIFPSIRVFSNELAVYIRWPEYWSFSFSPSNEYSGLISFRMDLFDLLAVQGVHTWLSEISHLRDHVKEMIMVICKDLASRIFNTELFIIANYLTLPK